MEILREILNFVGGVVRMKSFFFRLSGISLDRQRGGGKQATQQEQLGYRVCGVTGPGSYTSQSSLSIPLSFSFTLSPSRFPPDPASSYFARFPQMLIALFPNANSFLTSERRVYPAFFSLSLSFSFFSFFLSIFSSLVFSLAIRLQATGSIHSPSPWAARTRLCRWNQVRESCR